MRLFSFTKEERILKRTDFNNLKIRGKKHHTKNFTIIIKPNGRDTTRLGITVSKRIGKSVTRNRIKRLIREFFRLHKHKIPKGYDVLIVATKKNDTLNLASVEEQVGDLLVKNGNLIS